MYEAVLIGTDMRWVSAYESVPLWQEISGPGAMVIFGLLLTFAASCVPGILLMVRKRDFKWGGICLALGVTGFLLVIPWIVAVVFAAQRLDFFEHWLTKLVRLICGIGGGIVVVIGCLLIFWGIRDYQQAQALYMEAFYGPVIINQIVQSAGLLVAAVVLIITACVKGRAFWGCQMASAAMIRFSNAGGNALLTAVTFVILLGVLAVTVADLFLCAKNPESAGGQTQAAGNGRDTLSGLADRNAMDMLGGLADQAANRLSRLASKYSGEGSGAVKNRDTAQNRSAAQNYSAPNRSAAGGNIAPGNGAGAKPERVGGPGLTGRLYCVSGQYRGAMLALNPGETFCIGSEPAWSHLILEDGAVGPLHAQLIYLPQEQCYELVHPGEYPVYMGQSPLPQVARLRAGDMFCLGTRGQQVFQVL